MRKEFKIDATSAAPHLENGMRILGAPQKEIDISRHPWTDAIIYLRERIVVHILLTYYS